MPGLNPDRIEKLEWNGSTVQDIAEILLTLYGRIYSNSAVEGCVSSSYYTPYQFTLPLMQALYHLFEECGVEVDKRDCLLGQLKATNPESRDIAFHTSLRAIAYLSWEPESRVFLVRRVYPTYFDFLAVSHVPEGWGVSSIMLDALQRQFSGKTNIENGGFFWRVALDEPANIPFILPYLAEQERLGYKHVFILPVFAMERPLSDRDMLGTFLFFLADADGIPQPHSDEENKLCKFAKELCQSTSKLVGLHNMVLAPSPLEAAWQKLRKSAKPEARIAQVVLNCRHHEHGGKVCLDLENATRKFLNALTIPNYYAIRDSITEKDEKYRIAVLLVAARPGVELDKFRKGLLHIVTETLSDKKLGCKISIKASGPAPGSMFQLNADEE